MDNITLRDNFRQQLTDVHAITILVVSIIEIIGYVFLVWMEIETFAVNSTYLWLCVIAPIFINFLTHAIARYIVNNKKAKRKTKNTAIITAALVTSLIIAVIHREYMITSCAFVFPIVLSAMFNDKKLLLGSFISSLFIILCVAIAFKFDESFTAVNLLSLFILLGFAFVAFFCGIISIDFSFQNYTTIKQHIEKNDKLRNDLLKDQMTGLYNHTTLFHNLDNLVAEQDTPFFLAMIDLDNFKKVNDNYGHDCGDVVLTQLADIILNNCDNCDIAYRYGGEEFAIIFTQKDGAQVDEIMQNILFDLRKHKFPFTSAQITFSAGIVEFYSGLTSGELFEMADSTLYSAKKEGKNRIFWGSPTIEDDAM